MKLKGTARRPGMLELEDVLGHRRGGALHRLPSTLLVRVPGKGFPHVRCTSARFMRQSLCTFSLGAFWQYM